MPCDMYIQKLILDVVNKVKQLYYIIKLTPTPDNFPIHPPLLVGG